MTLAKAVDFWRVSDLQKGRSLELRAEMKLPGEAELPLVGLGGVNIGLLNKVYVGLRVVGNNIGSDVI